jgi:hypothetical protein
VSLFANFTRFKLIVTAQISDQASTLLLVKTEEKNSNQKGSDQKKVDEKTTKVTSRTEEASKKAKEKNDAGKEGVLGFPTKEAAKPVIAKRGNCQDR